MDEWRRESDVYAGTVNGYNYVILRNGFGCLCGYLVVFKNHPWYGKSYEQLEGVVVHGGLTYSDTRLPCSSIFYYDEAKDETSSKELKLNVDFGTEAWILGFNCCHNEDLSPVLFQFLSNARLLEIIAEGKVYRNLAYVYNELESLSIQAAMAVDIVEEVKCH
jgi:hypothetical protein